MQKVIRCPECNVRLFDLKSREVELVIKCPRCKEILEVARSPDSKYITLKNSYRATETMQTQ